MRIAEKLNIQKLNIGQGEAEGVWRFLFYDEPTIINHKFNDALDVIGYLRDGFPKSGIDSFLEKTSVSRSQLSRILHISSRQLNRYDPDDRLSPEQSNFLYELTRIYNRATNILGDQTTAEHWLNRGQVALGNKTPLEILDTTEGLRLVDDLLYQIEYGFYS
jgi:putative toxin-antitoxin system antitoxin component (TIGR02293 family)